MPELRGLSLNQAIALIELSDLKLGKIKIILDEERPENMVVEQDPLAGNRVLAGRSVDLGINRRYAQKKDQSGYFTPKGVGLFRHRLKEGFLKKHVVVRMNGFGISIDLLDDYRKPGEDIWLLIPQNNDITVRLYEDDQLIRTQVYE
jgi:serine/threonine-protein kinase